MSIGDTLSSLVYALDQQLVAAQKACEAENADVVEYCLSAARAAVASICVVLDDADGAIPDQLVATDDPATCQHPVSIPDIRPPMCQSCGASEVEPGVWVDLK